MKQITSLLVLLLLSISAYSQIQVRTEYIGSSNYKDIHGNKTGGKGGAMITSMGVNVPLSLKMDENNRPTMWSVAMGGSYTSFDNKDIPRDVIPSEILNTQLNLVHMRPISERWSLLASLGAGSYTAHARPGDIRMTNILMNGAGIFIYQLKDNLKLGGGLAINTSFGYPMLFPALYFQWQLQGKFEVDVQMVNALEASAGMRFNESVDLKLVLSADGALALERINKEKMMFTHQYFTAGLRPTFTFGKVSVPVTVGISAARKARYKKRTLKAMFESNDDENDTNFNVAPYASVGLNYRF